MFQGGGVCLQDLCAELLCRDRDRKNGVSLRVLAHSLSALFFFLDSLPSPLSSCPPLSPPPMPLLVRLLLLRNRRAQRAGGERMHVAQRRDGEKARRTSSEREAEVGGVRDSSG